MFHFIYQCMLGQKKLYIIMLVVLTLLATIELYFAGIYTAFMGLSGSSAYIIRTLATFISFLSCFLTLFINQFFLEGKTEELSIFMITGGSAKKSLSYIIIQFGIFYVVATLLAIPLGALALSMTINLVAIQLDSIIHISLLSLLSIFGSFVIMKLIFVLLLNVSFLNRVAISIYKYMTSTGKPSEQSNDFFSQLPRTGKAKFPVGSFFIVAMTIVLFFVGIKGLVSFEEDMSSLLFSIVVLLVSFLLVINTWIPLSFNLFHDRYLMKKPFLLFSLCYIKQTMKTMSAMINMNAIFIPMTLCLFVLPVFDGSYTIFLMICYIALMLMLFLGFFIRFHVYLPTKSRDIATMRALGYKDIFIIRIQKVEVFTFVFLTFILPFLCFSYVLGQGYLQGFISLGVIGVVLIIYVFFYGMFSIYIYWCYQKQAKEVLGDVRYLNRSE